MKHASLKLRKKTHTFLYISETRYAFIIYKKRACIPKTSLMTFYKRMRLNVQYLFNLVCYSLIQIGMAL